MIKKTHFLTSSKEASIVTGPEVGTSTRTLAVAEMTLSGYDIPVKSGRVGELMRENSRTTSSTSVRREKKKKEN